MIGRRRRRPRVRSSSFRTLWWLVRREAALRILCPDHVDVGPSYARRWLLELDGRELARLVELRVRVYPAARFYPRPLNPTLDSTRRPE